MDFEFTQDWTQPLRHTLTDKTVLEIFDKPVRLLEIGVYEGRSATLFRPFMQPGSTYTGVDPWFSLRTPAGWVSADAMTPHPIEQRARSNLRKAFGHMLDRMRLFRGRSSDVVPGLGMFDVIYIDGDHTPWGVLTDSDLAWKHLAPGGIIIWDDMTWRRTQGEFGPVGYAALAFLSDLSAPYTIVRNGQQLVVQKRG